LGPLNSSTLFATRFRSEQNTGELQSLLAKIGIPQQVERRETLTASIAEAETALKALPSGKMVFAAATHFAPQGSFKPTEGKPRPNHVLQRGEVQRPGDEVAPWVLPRSLNANWQLEGGLSESQRRAELARWLTRPDHPLVWRSIVNRIWQYHFGQGTVAAPNDFGRMGAEPPHPQCLDWLACEFRDGGQAFKALHRLMVTSTRKCFFLNSLTCSAPQKPQRSLSHFSTWVAHLGLAERCKSARCTSHTLATVHSVDGAGAGVLNSSATLIRSRATRAASLFSLPRIRSPFSPISGIHFFVPGSV
jgi:hypothetical protein